MNTTQLRKIGVPDSCITAAIGSIQNAVKEAGLRTKDIKSSIAAVLADPVSYQNDPCFGNFAAALIDDRSQPELSSVPYRTWGSEIDNGTHAQMALACKIPSARMGALMPDAHVGYGLPIGGVLGLEGTVCPYAVGVDIACRMKLSVFDIPVEQLESKPARFENALDRGTRFGVGSVHEKPKHHAVMEEDWTITRITREHKDKAWKQLGTSGSGNHFVEFGELTLTERSNDLGLEPGSYVAVMSHSGSRGSGAAVCDTYSSIARARLPRKYEEFGRLAWLDLDSEAGQEYWEAMNLMGRYAAANHDVIHRLMAEILGAEIVAGVENHHNFAWKEMHDGRELIVHRKGATPASPGELGVIPGSMADPAFVVRGLGQPDSLRSASHGAGRKMSRTAARETYSWNAVRNDLAKKGVRVLSAGADEVPYAYKNILAVMAEQSDLVEVIARFDPKIVKMSDDAKAED